MDTESLLVEQSRAIAETELEIADVSHSDEDVTICFDDDV